MPCDVQQKESCLFPWTHMYFHTNQKVYPCCKLVEHPNFELGNTTDSIEELWNSPVMKNLRLSFINKQEPRECLSNCFNNINPLYVHVPESFKLLQADFFNKTLADGSYDKNFIYWNVNESNVCNFACVYCCSSYSTKFDSKLKKSFSSLEDQLLLFKENAKNLRMISLSAGESHLQPGYYKMLEYLKETGLTHIPINVHSNMSGYMLGKQNFYELLNHFSDVTLYGSLDSYGERAEFIRHGTIWKDIEVNRQKLFEYPNIKFVAQSVISNLNLWSLPDFHYDWFSKGFLGKHNVHYYVLDTPDYLHISVMNDRVKQQVKEKLKDYISFLEEVTDKTYNQVTPQFKIHQILQELEKEPKTSLGHFNMFTLKQSIKTKINFNRIFPEFKI